MNAPLSVAAFPIAKVSGAGARKTDLGQDKPFIYLSATARLYRSSQCKLRTRYRCHPPILFTPSSGSDSLWLARKKRRVPSTFETRPTAERLRLLWKRWQSPEADFCFRNAVHRLRELD